jgi:uncharacterized repeat protein (TIGR01451 family)
MKLANAYFSLVTCVALLLGTLASSAAAQNWTQLSPAGTLPAGRIQAAVAFDSTNDVLIMFGGAAGPNTQTTAPVQNDVWVLSYADGLGGTPTWTQLSPSGTPPSARAAASAVYDPNTNSLIVFAGNSGLGGACGTVNDLWLLSNANGQGGTPQWTQLNPTGVPPPNRNLHTAVYDIANNRMIVFGGTDFCASDFNDVWVLENANNAGGMPTWIPLSPAGGPPTPRDSHTATYDPNTNTMTIFGGGGFTSAFGCPATSLCNDVWVLENANGLGGPPNWTQLSPTGGPPSPRNQLTATYDSAANRMTIFGGSIATASGLANDVWVLSEANGLAGTPAWMQLSPTGDPPAIRRTHSAIFNPSSNRMTIFGGFTNTPSGSALNDTWVLSNANGVTGDSTPPVLSLPASITAEATGPNGAVVNYTVTATDNVDDTVPVTCTPASGSTFPLGTTAVACSSTDKAGNTATGSFTVTVRDSTPPTLSLPANITVNATAALTPVAFTATATDLVDGTDPVNCTVTSGSGFALGTTAVACSSTDKAGNTATGSFTVTVRDTTPPALSLPANITVNGTATLTPVTFTATATDNVDGSVPVTCNPASGSGFPVGTTIVNCQASDESGNTASGNFTVTVLGADLAISQTAVSGGPGKLFTITVVNNGPITAKGVVATDSVPAPFVFASASANCFFVGTSSTTVQCSLGSLAKGSAATLTLGVKSKPIDVVTNTATVSATTPDPNTTNNSSTLSK